MYNYLLNVTAANRKATFESDIINAVKLACKEANASTNSIRYGRKFSFIKKIDDKTLQIRLESETAIVAASRSISSITRALIKICSSEKLEPLKYNGSLLTATVVEEFKEGAEVYANLNPYEIVQSVVEIFFGQASLGNNDKKAAKKAADQIKDIVSVYKASVRK